VRRGLDELLETYRGLLASYEARGVSRVLDADDKENTDETARAQYFDVGEDALRLIIVELLANGREPPRSILDFPCGSGRVTRHLRAAFPTARIGACDLYESHVDFCAREFDAEPVYSREDLDAVELRPEWDVIFVGSLLTHLPKRQARQALALIERGLSDTGLAIVTLEGRRSIEIQTRFVKIIGDRAFRRIMLGYRLTGHGFAEYERAFRRSLFHKQATYGSAFVRPDWMAREILRLPNVRLLGYAERAWNDHQDVVVFGRPAPTDLAPG
jgi:SAM-dependent methyltransferase